MKSLAVIPARYQSSRLPGKPLADLAGKPMIERVYQAVLSTGLFTEVIIATDDDRIFQAVEQFGGRVQMTSPNHASGSDRIAEIAKSSDADIIVNVQGDEPFITKEPLEALLATFGDSSVHVASLMHLMNEKEDIDNPNNVKVVTDIHQNALYFSRSVIPYDRNGDTDVTYYKHIGVYAYRKDTLLQFVSWPVDLLEQTEKLEQLRLLAQGISIRMVLTEYKGIGIDTPDDLKRANDYIKGTIWKNQ